MSETENQNPFHGPQLQDKTYTRADMSRSHFDGVNMAGAKFFAVMTKTSFGDTNLGEADFDDVNLGAARFNNVNMSDVTITYANLSGLKIDGVNLTNAQIDNADLTGMKINGVLVTDLFAALDASKG
jgi:uncharacterized protein YjbI with pentapeptide repeats